MATGAWPILPQSKSLTEPGLAEASAGAALGLGPPQPSAASLPVWEPQQSSYCLGVSTLVSRVHCPLLRRRAAGSVLTDSLSPLFPALR